MSEIHFKWPTNQNIELDKQLQLLKLLISYSSNLNKLEIFTKELNMKSLDGLLEIQQLINEFNRENSISLETITKYKIFLKAQLMNDLIKNNLIKYLNTQNLITFFNQFNDSGKSIESYWMIKAQKLSQKYQSDFCISIPDFSQSDIIFLLVNPLVKEKSFFIKEIHVPDELFNDFYEISQKTISYDQIKIEIFEAIKKYVKSYYQKEYDQFLQMKSENFDEFMKLISEKKFLPQNFLNLFSIIQKVIEIGNKIRSNVNFEDLDFSDFEDLNNLDFNSFVNKHPIKGFYISQFPEIKVHMNSIFQLWGNRKEKFPLSLFEFRIFSKFHQIQFQLPSNELNESLIEIQEIVSREVISLLTEKNSMKFCHFIEFLFEKVPSFITKSFHSDYIRDIILSLIRVPKDSTIQQYIISFLKEFIPTILNKVGSSEWENLINEELQYETNDEIIKFLTNPWKFVLEKIDDTIRPGYSMNLNAAKEIYNKMKNMINSITTEKSIKELNKCVIEDIEFIKEKLIQDYNVAKNSIVTNQDVLDKWTIYSQQVSSFISMISTLPTTSMSTKSPPLLPGQSFDEFYKFFSQNLSSFSNNETRIIPFLPKKNFDLNYVHKLQYFYNGKNVEIHFKISTEKVMLFALPYDIQIDSLKMVSTSLAYKVLKIKYNHYKSKLSPSMSGIVRSYKQFDEFNNRLLLNSLRVDDCNRIQNEINQAKVVFGDFDVIEFIQKLNQLKSSLPDSFKNVKELNDITGNLMKELKVLTDVHYVNDNFNVSKPSNTLNFLNVYLKSDDLTDSIDLNSFMNFLECFPDYNSVYNELDQLLYNCSRFSLRPKNEEKIDFDKNDIKIDFSNNFLLPSVFKEGNSLKTTAKSIEINCDSLIFGVDLLPLQIRISNFTDEELNCQFEQTNEKLPLPTFKNDKEFLVIEIPVESICKNEDDSEEEKTFFFDGKIHLNTKYNSCTSTEIKYSIKLNYIESSNLNESKSNSFDIKVVNINDDDDANFELDFVSFPDKITVTSFYKKFNEILNSLYLLPSNIYELSKSNKGDAKIQALLNQLQTVYLWQKESSVCFPFCSLQAKFNKTLESTLNQLDKSKLNLSNFPYEFVHGKNSCFNFVQFPKLQFNGICKFDVKNETETNERVDLNDDKYGEQQENENLKQEELQLQEEK